MRAQALLLDMFPAALTTSLIIKLILFLVYTILILMAGIMIGATIEEERRETEQKRTLPE